MNGRGMRVLAGAGAVALGLGAACWLGGAGWSAGDEATAGGGSGAVPTAVVRALEAKVRGFEPVQPRTASRSLFEFALEASAWGWRPDLVERALELAGTLQQRDPGRPAYGNFRWYRENAGPEDQNAVEFCMQRGVLVWARYRERLTPGARERLRQLLEFGLEGVRRHRVSESYTNICLMKCWNLVALGEALGRPDAAAEGYDLLDRWFLRVDEEGIQEYLSHTYYAVDLECLGLLARFAGRAKGRRAAEAGLRLLWTDMAANWFAPAGRLGGARARDYDYLRGIGGIDALVARHGWLPGAAEPDVFGRLCAWTPPAELAKPSLPLPRTMVRRFGPAPWQTAVHYLGRTFSLGAAGAGSGPEDKPLTLDLAADRRQPLVRFFMDARGDPYGQVKFPQGRSGHQKAQHLEPFLTSVQRGPELLLLAAADPADPRQFRHAPDPACLLSHLFFPADLELWAGDQKVARPADGRLPVPPGATLFLRRNGTAAAIRLPLALDTAGRPAPVFLAWDGGRLGTARLTVEHCAGPPAGRGVVALWLRVKEGMDEPGFAAFRAQMAAAPAVASLEAARADVSVPGQAGALHLVADLARGTRLVREGAELLERPLLMTVDGRDRFRDILATVPAVSEERARQQAAERGAPGVPRPGIVVEAESAPASRDGLTVARDPQASGGAFAWSPATPGGPGLAPAAARWWVHFPADSPLRIWARVRTPTPEADSFFLDLGRTGERTTIEWHTGVHRDWTWVPVKDRGGAQSFPVGRGAQPLAVRVRETGAQIDCLFLATDPRATPPPIPPER